MNPDMDLEELISTLSPQGQRYFGNKTSPPLNNNTNTLNNISLKARNEAETEHLSEHLGTSSPKKYGEMARNFDAIMSSSGGGWQDKRDIAEQLGTSSTDRAFRSLLQRRREDGSIRVHNSRPQLIQWINREYKITQLTVVDMGTFLNVKLPLKLHELVGIPPGSVIGAAGYVSAGKTSLLLETAELNVLSQDMPVYYWYNEMSEARLINRVSDFPLLVEAQKQGKFFPVRQGDFEFYDVLEPNAINLVDYLDRDEELYLIGKDIKQLQQRLENGIVAFALQKLAGRDFGYGGLPSAKLSNLYIKLDKISQNETSMIGQAEIIKAKDWLNENPVGLKCQYHTGGKFGKLFIDGNWQRSK